MVGAALQEQSASISPWELLGFSKKKLDVTQIKNFLPARI
jgi:hypothetical protein